MSEEQPSDRPNGAENLREEAAPGKRWKPVMLRWLQRLGLTSAVLAVLGALTVFGAIRYYESDLPSVEELRKGYEPPQVTRILARDGTLLASVFTERRTVIPLSDVPAHAKLAFLAAEDASFYEHQGLDYLGMLRALVANLRAGHTQWLVVELLSGIWNGQIGPKVEEIVLDDCQHCIEVGNAAGRMNAHYANDGI